MTADGAHADFFDHDLEANSLLAKEQSEFFAANFQASVPLIKINGILYEKSINFR